MNVKEIKELLVLMQEHGLSEVEIEKDGLKIKLKKNGSKTFSAEAGGEYATVIPMPLTGETSHAAKMAAIPAESPDMITVKSPMVGTFYSAAGPDQPSYVKTGQSVKEGDVLCIIEAMKLMNEIKCEIKGTVVEVMVANGQPVEFDQPLFKIKKN